MQKKLNVFVAIALLSAGLATSCDDDESTPTSSVEIATPKVAEGYESTSSTTKVTATNTTTGEVRTFELDSTSTIVLADGLYDIVLTTEGTQKVGEKEEAITLRAVVQNVVVSGGSMQLSDITFVPIAQTSGFKIVEVGLSSVLPEGVSSYNGDQYFRIFNTGKDTLYADGLCIFESGWTSGNDYSNELTPDYRKESVVVGALYQIPGSGKEHPVAPGESILICDVAKDHTADNVNSWDLSEADFEWYDETKGNQDTDTETPNLTNIYKKSATIWLPNKQGNTSFGICFLPDNMSAEQFIECYAYDYSYLFVFGELVKTMTNSYYYIPNSWIADFVCLAPGDTEGQKAWYLDGNPIETSYVSLGESGKDANRLGKAARRKVVDGAFVDTDDSANDFEVVEANPHYEF